MTLGHFLYIPGVLCLGLLIGYILGGRAVEVARADRAADDARKAARRARRDAAEAEDAHNAGDAADTAAAPARVREPASPPADNPPTA